MSRRFIHIIYPPVTNMCQHKGIRPCFCNILPPKKRNYAVFSGIYTFWTSWCVNFSHQIVLYAHFMVYKCFRLIDDGMKGRTMLQKSLEDAEIGTITAFGQVWLRTFSLSKIYVCRLLQPFSDLVLLKRNNL